MLGHRPDEFGLVPDADGFVTYKELLQAIHEEQEWRYVRRSHINEVLLGKDRPLFQSKDNAVRVLERRWRLDIDYPAQNLPKVLFAAVRARAHPVAMEKGLKSAEGRYLVLSPDKDMALRMGKRRDQKPVLLNISAAAAEKEGVLLFSFGGLFLGQEIPARFISGPPVSKEIREGLRERKTRKEKPVPRPHDFTAGTFSLDILRDPDSRRRKKAKKRKGWKEEAKKIRSGGQ